MADRGRVPLDTDVRWIHGAPSPRRRHDPPLQVHQLAPGTVLIRQSKDLTYEAPFILLLLGAERALLLDTGAVDGTELRRTVDGLLDRHAATRAGDTAYALVVAHTHGHGDHVAGDAAFVGRPHTTVVGHDVTAVRAYFGFTGWPAEVVTFDLGDRMLEVFAIPGHHAASVAVFDPSTGLLHTGDTVYPGRIYVEDSDALLTTLDRLVAFCDERDVTHVLGCHVEMTDRPGRDYARRALPARRAVALHDHHAAGAGARRLPGCRSPPRHPPVRRRGLLHRRGPARRRAAAGQGARRTRAVAGRQVPLRPDCRARPAPDSIGR